VRKAVPEAGPVFGTATAASPGASAPSGAGSTAAAPAASGHGDCNGTALVKRRVLLVDDEEAITFATRRYFERRALQVDVASALDQAKAFVAQSPYDLVVVDLRLTGALGAEGLDLLSHVHEHQPAAKCVLLSAYVSAEVERAALDRGAELVLRKPISLPDLGDALMGLLPR
jgi:two-component system response regulator (stage 0 sporulation protein F)